MNTQYDDCSKCTVVASACTCMKVQRAYLPQLIPNLRTENYPFTEAAQAHLLNHTSGICRRSHKLHVMHKVRRGNSDRNFESLDLLTPTNGQHP